MKKLTIQTLLFSIDHWTPSAAKKWLSDHGYKTPRVDTKGQYHRFRQEPPFKFVKGSFVTKTFDKQRGIKAVFAHLRDKSTKENPKNGDKWRVKAPSIPSILVRLGTLVWLKLSTGQEIKFGSRPPWELYTDASGKTLFAFEKQKSKKVEVPKEAKKEIRRYEVWSKFEADKAVKTTPYQIDEWRRDKRVKVVAIIYKSDKWTNKQTKYIHDFDSPVNTTNGITKGVLRAVVMKGRFRVTARGIVG